MMMKMMMCSFFSLSKKKPFLFANNERKKEQFCARFSIEFRAILAPLITTEEDKEA